MDSNKHKSSIHIKLIYSHHELVILEMAWHCSKTIKFGNTAYSTLLFSVGKKCHS